MGGFRFIDIYISCGKFSEFLSQLSFGINIFRDVNGQVGLLLYKSITFQENGYSRKSFLFNNLSTHLFFIDHILSVNSSMI